MHIVTLVDASSSRRQTILLHPGALHWIWDHCMVDTLLACACVGETLLACAVGRTKRCMRGDGDMNQSNSAGKARF